VSDCLGSGPVAIDAGQIGALRLDQTLAELHRICPNMRDTTAHGDESLDTAVVISRAHLSVIGRIATVADEEGTHQYVTDSARHILEWTITGTDGVLPGGVPLSAPYDSLARAYGNPSASPLNGDVYVWFCKRVPSMVFHFDDRLYATNPNAVKPDSYPSSLAGAHIASIDLPSRALLVNGCRP
jgi:hypothetical protein